MIVKKSQRILSPRSAAPVFPASKAGVFAPAAIDENTSSSIPVFKASVCWNAFIAMKIRSGVGRFVVLGVAMR